MTTFKKHQEHRVSYRERYRENVIRINANPKPRECLNVLDLVLFINGVKMYKSGYPFFNWVFRVIFIVYNYFHLFKNLYAFEFNAENMRKIIYVSVHLTAIISNHHFLKRSKKIRTLFKSVIELIQTKQRLEIKRAAKCGAILWGFGIFWGVSSGFLRWYRSGTSLFLEEEYLLTNFGPHMVANLFVATDIILFNFMSIGWFLNTVIIYGFFLYSIGKLNEVFFNSYGELSEAGATHYNNYFRSLRIVWHTISSLKEDFDSFFAIHPFLWFVCLFVECSLTLILFKYEYEIYAQQSIATILIDNWSLYMLRVLFVFGVTFIVERVNDLADELKRTFFMKLMTRHCRDEGQAEVSALIVEIKESIALVLTCWGTFKLNKSAILMFVNAVIPFSVLVLELTETISKSRPSTPGNTTLISS